MQHIIVGTAGHIDHGKTSLVKALTGVDTDRFEEEKRRGISIDLGFAHIDLNPNLRLGFIDVPGHERFVKNMLAGVAGIDLVVLIIAADESIKPQTREHFDICRLLGIHHGLVVLTKSDLVDPELLGLVRLEAEEFVAGSFLEGAPIVPVSAVTGAGLADLRAAFEGAAASIKGKDSGRHPRLPIDRSFSIKGHGAVVTGTLISGAISLHDELELYPVQKRVRVRGLEVHGARVERASAGERTAVNLGGIDSSEAVRGMTLASPGLFNVTKQVDCIVDLLPGVLPLKHRAPVHFHAGTAEVQASARLITSLEPMLPGTRAYVRFLLSDPLLLLPGDRFIVRKFSPVITIGGGVVIDIAAPRRMRRTDLLRRLEKLNAGTTAERVALLVSESEYGMSIVGLVARTGLLDPELRKIAVAPEFIYLPDPHAWVMSRAWTEKKIDRFRDVLKEFHRKNPLQSGLAKEDVRSRELAGSPPFLFDALLALTKDIVAEGDLLRLSAHRVAFKQDEEQALAKIEALFQRAGLTVPSTTEVLAKSGVEPARARSLLQILLRQGKLVRVGEEFVFHASALQTLRRTLAAHKGQRFSVTDFKEWTGLSRKYAIPLLEFMDQERVTRRERDDRIVL